MQSKLFFTAILVCSGLVLSACSNDVQERPRQESLGQQTTLPLENEAQPTESEVDSNEAIQHEETQEMASANDETESEPGSREESMTTEEFVEKMSFPRNYDLGSYELDDTSNPVHIRGFVSNIALDEDFYRVRLRGPVLRRMKRFLPFEFEFLILDSGLKDVQIGDHVVIQAVPSTVSNPHIKFSSATFVNKIPDDPEKADENEQWVSSHSAFMKLAARNELVRKITFGVQQVYFKSTDDLSEGHVALEILEQLSQIKKCSYLFLHAGIYGAPRFSDAGLAELPADLPVSDLMIGLDDSATSKAFEAIAKWNHLKTLVVRREGESYDDAELAALSKLKLLNLKIGRSKYSDNAMKQIGKIASLKFLDIRETQVTPEGLSHLKVLKNLEGLSLGKIPLKDDNLEILASWPKLEYLDVNSTGIGDSALANIARLDSLVELNLGNTAITDEGISYLIGLEKLQVLRLYETNITDVGLQHLSKIKSLRNIYLSSKEEVRKTTATGEKALSDSLPNVQVEYYSDGGWPFSYQ